EPAVAVGPTLVRRALLIDSFRVHAELGPEIAAQQRVQAVLPELCVVLANRSRNANALHRRNFSAVRFLGEVVFARTAFRRLQVGMLLLQTWALRADLRHQLL